MQTSHNPSDMAPQVVSGSTFHQVDFINQHGTTSTIPANSPANRMLKPPVSLKKTRGNELTQLSETVSNEYYKSNQSLQTASMEQLNNHIHQLTIYFHSQQEKAVAEPMLVGKDQPSSEPEQKMNKHVSVDVVEQVIGGKKTNGVARDEEQDMNNDTFSSREMDMDVSNEIVDRRSNKSEEDRAPRYSTPLKRPFSEQSSLTANKTWFKPKNQMKHQKALWALKEAHLVRCQHHVENQKILVDHMNNLRAKKVLSLHKWKARQLEDTRIELNASYEQMNIQIENVNTEIRQYIRQYARNLDENEIIKNLVPLKEYVPRNQAVYPSGKAVEE